ncbi:twitchin-like isoform X7 [Amphiura filiformis]|uniref:twitchin-like isoform X7 n=1 Tax=Amphiura filiformis TaxID=82378 RepID=UPI003B2276F0
MVKEAGPTFIKKPSLNQSDDGRILTFSCQIAGEPRPNFKWILGDKEIKSGGRYRSNVKKAASGYQVTLDIEDVNADDAGSYKIVADNKFGNTSATIALKFGDADEEEETKTGGVDGIAPNFTMKPKMKQSDDGGKLNIETELCADPEPEIKWYIGDKVLKDGGRLKIKQRRDGEFFFLALEITDVSEDDGGEYKIIAKNKLGSATNTIKLNFARGGGAPSFTMKPRIEQSDDGRKLTFHCELTADPKPELTWFKGEKQLSPGPRHKMITKASEGKGFYTVDLNITDVSTTDGGNYKVVAKNEHGEAKSTIELNFEGGDEEPMDTSEPAPTPAPAAKKGPGAPKFLDKPSMRQADDGHRVTFECQLTAEPDPEVTWYRNTDIIKDKGRWRIKQSKKEKVFTQTLIMDRVTPDDSGTYICYAKNKAGDDKAIINLNFDVRQASTEGAPTFIEQPNIKQEDDGHRLVMEVKVLADPEPEITWHFNNLELRNKIPYKIRQSKQGTKVYICVLEVANITQKDQGNYKVVAENTKGKASSTMAIKFEVKDYKKPRNFTLSHQVAPMQVDFVTPMEFEFGPEGPIKVGGGFHMQEAEFIDTERVSSDGLVDGKVPFDLPDRKVEEGEPAAMKCKVAGKIKDFKWFKDGKQLKEGKDMKFHRVDDTFEVEFMSVSLKDVGKYELVTDGEMGKKTQKCEMKVVDPSPETLKRREAEKKKKEPEEKKPKPEDVSPDGLVNGKVPTVLPDRKIEDGEPAKMQVKVPGNIKDFKWYKDGKQLKDGKDIKFHRRDDVFECEFMNVKLKTHVGKYELITDGPAGKKAQKCEIKVVDPSPETLKRREAEKKKKPEEKKPKPEDVSPDGLVNGEVPTVLPDRKIEDGEPAKMAVKVPGNIKDFKWYKDGAQLKDGKDIKFHRRGDVFECEFMNVKLKTHVGKYELITDGPAGKKSQKCEIKVVDPSPETLKRREAEKKKKPEEKKPEEKKPKAEDVSPDGLVNGEVPTVLPDRKIEDGEPAKMAVKVPGNIKDFKWYKDGAQLKEGKDIKFHRRGDVFEAEFLNVKLKTHVGKYELVTDGPAGKKSQKCEIKVVDPSPATLKKREEEKKRKPGEKAPAEKTPVEEPPQKKAAKAPVEESVPPPVVEEPMEQSPAPTTEAAPPDEGADEAADSLSPMEKKKGEQGIAPSKADQSEVDTETGVQRKGSIFRKIEPVKKDAPTEPVKESPTGVPYFIESPSGVEIHEGQIVLFEAVVDGDPQPKLTWYKGPTAIKDGFKDRYSVKYSEKSKTHSLEIKKVEQLDKGKFSCKIENESGKDERVFALTVKEPKKGEDKPASDELDFRAMLKKRSFKREPAREQAAPDWGKLKEVEGVEVVSAEITAPMKKQMFVGEREGRMTLEVGAKWEGCKPKWYKNGKEIVTDKKNRIKIGKNETTLTVSNITAKDDSAMYKCSFENLAHSSCKIIVEPHRNLATISTEEYTKLVAQGKEPKGGVKPKVDFVTLLKSIEVHEGADAKFPCELSGDALRMEWLHKDLVISKDKKYETKRLGRKVTLIIKNCQAEDIGEVTLRIDGRDSTANLGVKTKPKFLKELQPITVVEKDPCAMECDVSDLTSKVKWMKGTTPLKMGDRIRDEMDGHTRRLIFETTEFNDAGEYVCKFETIQSAAKLTVDEPPKFGKNLEPTKEAFAHEDAVFEAEVTSPAAECYWFKDGELLEPSDKHEIISDGLTRKLIVHDCAPEDKGRYACAMDDERKTFSDLQIEAPPTIDVPEEMKNIVVKRGEPAEISLPLSGSPPPEVKWTKDGIPVVPDERIQELTMPDSATLLVTNTGLADGGEYEVEVTNKHGTVKEKVNVVIIDKPGAPQSIKVRQYDETWIKVGWFPPADTGNCDIDHYVLQYKEGKRGDWKTASENIPDLEYTVPDLTTGKEYWFQVAAVNEVGQSPFVATDAGQEAKEPCEPADQMDAPEIVETHDGEITVAWEPPEFDGGKPIKEYVLEKREPGGRWTKASKEPIKGTEHTVTGLPKGAPYEFRVSAVNKAGPNEPSPPSKVAKAREPIDPASSPGTPVVEDVTKDAVKLSWEKPATEGGAPIEGYHVEKKNPDTGDWERVNDKPIKDTKYTVPEDKLTEGEETAFRVVAENEAGLSEPSEATPPVIVKDPEIPPTIDVSGLKDITCKAGENFKIAVKFDGFPAPSAKWFKADDELSPNDRVKIRGNGKETEMTQLDAEREDTGVYSVTCENAFGKESAKCNVTVLDIPKPPKGPLKVTDVFANQCVLIWEPPEDDGGCPLRNYVIEKRDASRTNWGVVNDTTKECSIKVPKLIEGVEYLFRVAAENQMGVSRFLEAEKPTLAKNPYSEPGAPGTPEVTDWDTDFVDIEWEEPEDDGGAPIDGYIIEKKEKKSRNWVTCNDKPVKGTSFKVPKLVEGREYEFKVSAVNKGGQGKPSQASQPKLVKAKFAKPYLKGEKLRDVTVKAGNKIVLNVLFDGSPAPAVEWKKNGEVVQASDHVHMVNEDENTLIQINIAERSDAGEYELTLTNDSGVCKAKCNVNVQGKPGPPEGPMDVSDVTQEGCKLSWNPPLDNGGSEITNYIVEKKEADDDYWQKVTGFCTAPHANVTKLEKGKEYIFRVIAENNHGDRSEPLESGLVLAKNPYDEPDRPGKPNIVSYDRDRAELEWAEPASDGGDKITGYTIEKKEPRQNRWMKCNKSPIIGTKHTVTGLYEGKQYEFRVIAENRAGPSEPSDESDLMTAKPMFEPPKVDFGAGFGPKDIKVRAGDPFDIVIPFKGSPPPTAYWYKDNKEIRPSERLKPTTEEEKTVLDCKKAERGDTGPYKVTLENNQGTDNCSLNVIVLDRPTQPVGPLEYTEPTRESIKLNWKAPEDDGNGTISGYIVEKRDANRDNWTKVTSAAPISGYTVQDLHEGNNYVFRVSAVNQYGVSDPLEGKQVTAKLPFDEPDSPGTPKIEAVDKTSAKVSWEPPENDGGSPVTGYIVEVKDPATGKWNKANNYPVKGTSYEVPNLEEGNEYQFRVVAENEAGPGKPSRASEAVIAKDPILPADAPGRCKVDKVKKDNVALSWAKPIDDGGAPITDYVVEKRKVSPSGHKGDWEKAAEVPAKNTNAVVPDLEPGEKYEFRVAAVNESGPGKFTSPTPVITAEDKPEPPVLNISDLKDIKVKGGEKIEIKLPFTGFPKPDITWTLNGEPVPEENIRNTAECTTLTVPSATIQDGGKYAVTLKNPSGQDKAKCNVKVLDAPDTPQGPLKVSDITPESCTLAWKPPKHAPEEVENYVVEKKDGETGRWTPVSSFVPNTHFKMRNLRPGEEYQFRVMAQNPYGVSKPITSDPIIAKHPFDAPSAPEAPEAKETDRNAITLGWRPPADDGGSPITGYIVEKREEGTSKWIPVTRTPVRETQCVAPRLVEGNAYEFQVKAVNAAGESKPSETSEAITAQPPPMRPKIPLDSRHKEVTVLAGEQYKVEIPFEASPVPTVAVTRDEQGGQAVPLGDRQKVEEQPGYFTLVNTYAAREDTGRYTVTLNNPQGSDKCTVRVTVVDKPGPPEGPLEASDVMADSCKLSWNPPKDDGGSKVTNYIVEMKEDHRPNWSKVSSFVRSPQYEVGDLDEGAMYNFRVRAENEYGISEPLDMSFPVKAKNPYDRPDAPGKPVVKDVEKGYVSLSWEPPEFDGGSKILGYNVEKRDEDFDWAPANDFLVKDTTLSLSNLQPMNTYEFRVLAKNAAGWSRPSKPSESVQPKDQFTTSDKPGTPHATDVGKTSVDLAWTKPVNDGGSPIKGYTVEKREKGNPNWEKANSYPIKDTHFTVPDLEPGKDYEFRVIPVNAAGEGEPSVTDQPISTKPAQIGKAPYFERKIGNQKEGQGNGVKFEAEVTGFPEPEIRWFRAGVEIFPSNRQRMRKNDDVVSLTIEDLRESDAGEYVCEASNKHGTEKCRAKLQVELAPEISRSPNDITVEASNPFKVKIPFKGTGNIAAKCLKNGEPIHENDRVKLTVFDDYVLLNVKDTKPEDAGAFKIAIENDVGGDFSSFNVTVLDRPAPCKGPLEATDITDHTLTLTWKPPPHDGGSPIKNYVVHKKEEGKDWTTVGSFVKGSPMNVMGLTKGSPYLFRVAAENEVGQSDWLEGDGPVIAKNPYDPPGKPGTPDVEEVGKSFVSLAWTRPEDDGGSPIIGYDIEKAEAGTDRWVKCNMHPVMTLGWNVPSLIEDRKYEFRVFAVNKAGRGTPSSASNSVTVKDPNEVIRPKFEQPLEDQVAVEGRKCLFECVFSGKPKPDVRWFKGPRELYNSDKVLITVEGELTTLTMSNLYGTDQDEYSCEIENPGGKKVTRANLTIKCAPKIKLPARFKDVVVEYSKHDQIKIKVPFTGFPKPECSWAREGTPITSGVDSTERHTTLTIDNAQRNHTGVYKVTAENELGSDAAVIKIAVNDAPAPVTNLRAQDITYDSVELTWNLPTDDGGSSPSFIVDKKEHGSDVWTRASSTGLNKATVMMLTPNLEYTFRVKADNLYGTSEPVEVKHTIKMQEPKKPKKFREEDEEEYERPKRPKLPKINDYDQIVEEGFTPTKVKLSKRSPYDRYIFGEELGRGPYGVIVRAQERATGRNFAAKFIDIEPGDAEHVKREIENYNHLQHPRLAQLYDAFETKHPETDKDQFVLIYDFMSGGDAFQRASERDHLTEEEVARYTKQVLQGLNHIHTRNYMHLDLKPQSVLYETKRGDTLKIIDMGLATKLDPDERTKLVYRSTDYSSPEVLSGGDVGFNTDMWTVGVLCYMLLSGIHPFDHDEDNIRRAAWEFDKNAFRPISDEGKDFISRLLLKDKDSRMTAYEALDHPWLQDPSKYSRNRIPTDLHRKLFLAPGWLCGDHILGIGRLGDTSAHRRNRPQEKDFHRDVGMDRRDCKPRFVKKPKEGFVMEDRDAKFECQVAAVTEPVVTWQRNQNDIKPSLKHKTKQSDITYTLSIGKTALDDAGSYVVHAKNSFGEISCTVNLSVTPDPLKQPLKPKVREKKFEPVSRPECKPNFDFRLRPRDLQENDNVRLSCIASGYPEPKVIWLHNGKEIEKVHADYKQTFNYRLAVLEIDNAKLEHAGVYTCVAENKEGTVETEARITVQSKDAAKRRAQLSQRSSTKKSGYSDEVFSSGGGRTSRRSRRTEEEDVVEERSERKSAYKGPVISTQPSSVDTSEGQAASFSCSLAEPADSVEWLFDDRQLEDGGRFNISADGATYNMEIPMALETDSGDYTFKAKNSHGECQANFSLKVSVEE